VCLWRVQEGVSSPPLFAYLGKVIAHVYVSVQVATGEVHSGECGSLEYQKNGYSLL